MRIRDRFSLPAGLHYLNGAYMSPLSKAVVEAGLEGVRRQAAPFEVRPADFFAACDRARGLFARLIGAGDPQRIAIIPSTSYGMAQAARNTPLARGQNVVMVHQEFPSNMYVWRRRCTESGAQLRVVSPPTEGPGREEAWSAAVTEAIDEGTAVVSLSSVHWTDGTRFDLEGIGERARRAGAALLVDGTQSVGAMPFDLARVRPDALICAAYKWLTGPYSIGLAYFGERYDDGVPIEDTWMVRRGSDDFPGLVNYTDEYRPGAIRYDVGETSNFVLVPMLLAALTQVLEWGPDRIQEHGRGLTDSLVAELREAGFRIAADGWRGAHLMGLRLPAGTDPDAVQANLRERNVHVSVRGSSVRVSVHLYNDREDVEALRTALAS